MISLNKQEVDRIPFLEAQGGFVTRGSSDIKGNTECTEKRCQEYVKIHVDPT